MRTASTYVFLLIFAAGATAGAMAADSQSPVPRGDAPEAFDDSPPADTPRVDKPDTPPKPDAPPPADAPKARRRHADRSQRPPSGARAGARRGPGLEPPGKPRQPHMELVEGLLPIIAEQHPELANRLRVIRKRDPREFERLLAEALAVRLEDVMRDDARPGMRPGPHGLRPPPGPHGSPPPPGPWPGFDEPGPEQRENIELHKMNESLERHSVELAREYHKLREREGQSEHARPRLEDLRRQIAEGVEKHFNVRTELRRFELHRVERELDRVREVLKRIHHDLERREDARGPIIERRLRQLLGEDTEGW